MGVVAGPGQGGMRAYKGGGFHLALRERAEVQTECRHDPSLGSLKVFRDPGVRGVVSVCHQP